MKFDIGHLHSTLMKLTPGWARSHKQSNQSLVQLYLIADGKLHVGGGILLGHFHDLVPDVLGVLHELVVVVHIVVDNQEGPEQQNKIN